MLKNVVLPLPLGPMMLMYSPAWISREMPFRACTSTLPMR